MTAVGKLFHSQFPSCPKPLFQSEANCEATDMKTIFHSRANKTHYQKKGFTGLASFKSEGFWKLGNGLLHVSIVEVTNIVLTSISR